MQNSHIYIYIYIFFWGGGNFFDCFIFQTFIIKFDYEKGLNHKPNKTPTNLPEPLKYMYLCMFIEKGITFKGQLSEKQLQCVYSTLYWLLSKGMTQQCLGLEMKDASCQATRRYHCGQRYCILGI